MKCVFESELTPSRFSEIGDPCRIFHDRERGLVAIASRTPHLGYPGRWLFPEISPSANRLSIYLEADGSLLGCIATKFPINDVSFSPDSESVVIATGSYDGGWCFEGYLLRFNWRNNETEQLLGQSRDFVACRHEPNGAITTLMRPENEEEFWETEQLDSWSIVLAVKFDGRSSPWKGAPVEVSREDRGKAVCSRPFPVVTASLMIYSLQRQNITAYGGKKPWIGWSTWVPSFTLAFGM